MGSKPFFSIVMPVYGVEKHLCKAIDSVLNQTFQDFEIILVDDCSPDKSPQICDEYAEKYGNVKVIHLEKNGGLSNARNVGQKYAGGKYILFMDSDDYVDDYLFEKVRQSLDENPAKIVIFGLVEEYFDENNVIKNKVLVKSEEKFLKEQQKVRENLVELEEKTLLGYTWNKFYDLEYLNKNGLQFEKITLIEDIVFNIKYTSEIDSMNILDITPYHYNRRINESLTNKFVPNYFELHYKRVKMLYDEYQEWGLLNKENEEIFANRLFRYILSALQRNCDKRSGMDFKERKKWMLSMYKDPWICHMLNEVHYNNRLLQALAWAVKKHKKWIVLSAGRVIYLVKNVFPIFFSRIKQG